MSNCANECCIDRLNKKRGIVPYEMADLYALQGGDLGGVAPLKKNGMTQYEKSGLSRKNEKNCKVTFENLTRF